jgi:hypothetical protein
VLSIWILNGNTDKRLHRRKGMGRKASTGGLGLTT